MDDLTRAESSKPAGKRIAWSIRLLCQTAANETESVPADWLDKQRLPLTDMAIHLLQTALKPGDIELAKLKNKLRAILAKSDQVLPHANLKRACINFACVAPAARISDAPEPSRSQLVSDILERRMAGDSFGCIAHALNKQGISGEHGGRWYGTTVRNIILRTLPEPN